jgi:hypothetical protein
VGHFAKRVGVSRCRSLSSISSCRCSLATNCHCHSPLLICSASPLYLHGQIIINSTHQNLPHHSQPTSQPTSHRKLYPPIPQTALFSLTWTTLSNRWSRIR